MPAAAGPRSHRFGNPAARGATLFPNLSPGGVRVHIEPSLVPWLGDVAVAGEDLVELVVRVNVELREDLIRGYCRL